MQQLKYILTTFLNMFTSLYATTEYSLTALNTLSRLYMQLYSFQRVFKHVPSVYATTKYLNSFQKHVHICICNNKIYLHSFLTHVHGCICNNIIYLKNFLKHVHVSICSNIIYILTALIYTFTSLDATTKYILTTF